MFYVGAYVHYNGANDTQSSRIQILEKLGHSRGRAERFLTTYPPKDVNGKMYRAIIFVLSDGFRLQNDAIRLSARVHHCDWTTAKFHCYRLGSIDALGKMDVWNDIVQKAAEAPEPAPVAPVIEEATVVLA